MIPSFDQLQRYALKLTRSPTSLINRYKRRLFWRFLKSHVQDSLVLKPIVPKLSEYSGAILFVAPEAGVELHYSAMCVLARTLQKLGHKVLFTRCFGIFKRCPVMDMYQVDYALNDDVRTEICLKCWAVSLDMLNSYGLEYVDLRPFITPDVAKTVRDVLQGLPSDLRKVTFNSIALGKLAAFDLSLATKLYDFERVQSDMYAKWLQYIESCLLGYILTAKLCDQYSISRVIHYNDYSIMLGARIAAQERGIPCFTASQASHRNVDRRRLVLLPMVWIAHAHEQLRSWQQWRELPLSPFMIREISDDLLTRLNSRGSHIYSHAKTLGSGGLKDQLGLSHGKKLLVAYTSSVDEAISGQMCMEGLGLPLPDQQQPFVDQIAWLLALTEFVESSSELELVVRIHPREGKNKRDPVRSEHLLKLQDRFASRPFDNCRFVWPEDPVSSYDLAELADLALISWSVSMALELSRMGVPVLASTKGVWALPQDDFVEWEDTPKAYFEEVHKLLHRQDSIDRILHAFRYYYMHKLGNSLNLGDVIPSYDFDELPSFRMPEEAEAIEEVIIQGKDLFGINYQNLKSRQNSTSAHEERIALMSHLRRVLHFLYTGEDTDQVAKIYSILCKESPINVRSEMRALRFDSNSRCVFVNGSETYYAAGPRIYSRYSPGCARLARLCGEAYQS